MSRESAIRQVEIIAGLLMLLSTADTDVADPQTVLRWLGRQLEEAVDALDGKARP